MSIPGLGGGGVAPKIGSIATEPAGAGHVPADAVTWARWEAAALDFLTILCCFTICRAGPAPQFWGIGKSEAVPPANRVWVLVPAVEGTSQKLGFMKNDEKELGNGALEYAARALQEVETTVFEHKGFVVADDSAMAGGPDNDPAEAAAHEIAAQYGSFEKEHLSGDLKANADISGELKCYSVQRDLLGRAMAAKSADLLVLTFARAEIVKYTPSGSATAVLASGGYGGPTSKIGINMAVVNPLTGRLLYVCATSTGGDFMAHPDRVLAKPIARALQPFFLRMGKK